MGAGVKADSLCFKKALHIFYCKNTLALPLIFRTWQVEVKEVTCTAGAGNGIPIRQI